MIYRTFISRLLIFGFLIGIGFCLARSVQYKSMLGVILALVSLGATIYFLYLLKMAQQEAETESR
jgi:hypothetical protein